VEERPATSHITSLYVRIKFLLSKSTEVRGGIFFGGGVKTCISAKLVFHIIVKKGFWKICAVELETRSSRFIILCL